MLKMAVKYNSIAPSEIRTPPNNGQRPRSLCVRYSEVPLYIIIMYFCLNVVAEMLKDCVGEV